MLLDWVQLFTARKICRRKHTCVAQGSVLKDLCQDDANSMGKVEGRLNGACGYGTAVCAE